MPLNQNRNNDNESQFSSSSSAAITREWISIPELRSNLNGRVITPEDAEYEEARTVFYGGIDRRPAVIVRAADANDVAYVISLARRPVGSAVRSGGHSMVGHSVSEGGIVLDLKDMHDLKIDAEDALHGLRQV
jgi:FAD/FMN-containing dehydrogenase